MALFPQLGPKYYSEKDKGILTKMEAFYSESITINQTFWGEADTDTRFEAGDQTIWNDIYGNLPANRRRQFNFNRIRRITNMISGHQRRNRMSTIVTPRENGDQQTADQFSKLMLWINQQEGILETISDSFHGALVTGMNLLHVWNDVREDPISGNIKVDNCSYNSFLIDPFFRKQDLSDCNAIWKRSFLTKRETISLLPENTDEILSLSNYDTSDGKFQFMPESYDYGIKNLLSYDEFYYRDFRSQKMMIDTQTGESMEWSGDDDRLKEFLQAFPSVTVIDQEVPTVKLAIVVQGKVMYHGPNPLGIDKYPFVPVLAYYNPQLPYFPLRVQGVVRQLRDSQYLYNRRKVIELDILESQINSGFKYKENALVNPKDIFLSGQGRGLALKEEAQMTDVEQIIPTPVNPTTLQISEFLGREMQEIAGVTDAAMGLASDTSKSGFDTQLRQHASLGTLENLFDQLDRSQKLLGQIIIAVVQTNFTPGKVKRVIEEEPTPQFYNKAFGKYDAVVEEGLNTSTQRQMQFAQLLQLRESGVAIPDEILVESATIQDKKKLTDAIQQQQQAAQQQQQAEMQAAIEEQQARTQLAQARAVADEGLGIERLSRVKENEALAVERKAEAAKDRQQAVLNMVKALKEIEDIDIQQLEKLVTLANIVKGQEMATNERPTATTSGLDALRS